MNDSQFEWQADGDENLAQPAGSGDRKRKSRSLWFIAALLMLIAVGALLLVRYFGQQQHRLENAVRQDVETNFELWERAVEEQDEELFMQLLDSDDREWRQTQRQLFGKDMIWQRPFLSLILNKGLPGTPQVSLAADWQRAVVTFEQTYRASPSSEFNGLVRLKQTTVFENKEAGWLQSAPDEDFWGARSITEGDLLLVDYPERDAELALRIGRLLEADLEAVCGDEAGSSDKCAQLRPFVLTMSTDVGSLLALESTTGPMLARSSFQMPAPTIVGLPLDEPSFQVFYQVYTRGILEKVQAAVGSPVPMPKQVIRTLCFDHPNLGPKLYKYVPAFGIWEAELPERSFRFLKPETDGQGMILEEMVQQEDLSHTRFIRRFEQTEELLLDEATGDQPYRVISSAKDEGSHLMLRRWAEDGPTYEYKDLNLKACNEDGCRVSDLPGFALWSADGQRTLLQVASQIFLGDAEGDMEHPLGTGFNLFWFNSEIIGTIRFNNKEEGWTTALVLQQITTGEEQIVFDNRDLAQVAGLDESDLSLKFVVPNPDNERMLLVQASGLREYAGQYFIFSVNLTDDQPLPAKSEILFRLQREGSLGGDAGQLTSGGYLPFSQSPDGRWLLISELSGNDPATRTFLLHDLQQNETSVLATDESVLPAQFPSYDWSDDGRWLVIAGDDFFRLLAPEYGYEQLVPHEFDYCNYARWSD